MKTWQMNKWRLLIACSMYKVIHEKYDDLLDGHDNVSVILLPQNINPLLRK